MSEKAASNMICEVLNETFTYLEPGYDESEIETLKRVLLTLSGIKTFEFSPKDKNHSYESIQDTLSSLNEKGSVRKSKGVYYTPLDVVRFIIDNSIGSIYGKLGTNCLHTTDPNGIPYRSFCMSKSVLDPTCGTGEFVLASLETKLDLIDCHEKNVTKGMIKEIVSTIYGNDINNESTAITKIRLFLCVLKRYGLKKCYDIDDILNENFTNKDFISKTPDLGRKFDLIIGNPPYVEDSKSELNLAKKYGNIYANVLKNSSELLNDNGTLGFVIPLSYVSTPRMKTIRNELFQTISEQYILSYADRPDCLFKSVHQKLCILIGKNKKSNKQIFTGNYRYWYKEERENLFDQTFIVKNDFAVDEYVPKLGTHIDADVYRKVCHEGYRERLIDLSNGGNNTVYVNMRATFWIKAFRQNHIGAEYKCFEFQTAGMADYFSCLINSSLFWWYWICVSDCWHITKKELQGFMVPRIEDFTDVSRLAADLENKLEETKVYVGTKQTDYEYKHRSCTDQIHAIDDFIHEIFGLTDEEGLYIKNFSYKYRIGGGA